MALLVVGIAVVANPIGWWNPGNFLFVDRVLFHPILGAMIAVVTLLIVGVDRIRSRALRVVAAVAVSLFLVLLGLVGLLGAVVAGGNERQHVSSEFGDTDARLVEAGLLGGYYTVVLDADRGIASRENEVLSFDTTEELGWYAEQVTSEPATAPNGVQPIHTLPTVEFVSAEQLVVRIGGTEYRVLFDPRTLEARQVFCSALPTVIETGAEVTYRCEAG